MNETLQAAINCNYSLDDLQHFETCFKKEVSKFPVMQLLVNKGRILYRCRKHEFPFRPFETENEITYRSDIENITEYGRCNIPGQSIFYGSAVSTELNYGYMTAIQETSKLLDEPEGEVINEGYEIYTFGMWRANKDIYVPVIPPMDSGSADSLLIKELNNDFETHLKKPEFTAEIIQLYSLMGKEISKEVKKHDSHRLYGLSATYANLFMQHYAAVAYPSVKAKQKAFNIAYNPKYFDADFDLIRVGVVDAFKFKKLFRLRNLMYADVVPQNKFEYKMMPPESRTSLAETIDYFKSKSIDIETGLMPYTNQIIYP